MKSILLLLLCALPAFGQSQSLAGGTGTSMFPTGALWGSLKNYRIQFRLHNWKATGSYQTIYQTNAFIFRVSPAGQVLMTSWSDGSLACYTTPPVVGADTTFVMQRDQANLRLVCDAFDTQTGKLVSENFSPITSPGIPNDSGQAVSLGGVADLAYVRTYNSVVPPGTSPGNIYDGSLIDYELNGDGTDATGHANLKMTGASYVPTPTYAPAAIFNPWPTINTFRAGTSMQLDASHSFSGTDNATLSLAWSQTAGPVGTYSSSTAIKPTLSGVSAGAYAISLTVTDSNNLSSSVSAIISAVNTDGNYIVNTGLSPAANSILGPLTMSGTSPWIYFDLAEIATGTSIATNALAYPPVRGAAISGTVTLGSSGGHNELIGRGTHFTTELTQYEPVIVAWDSIDGAGTGNYVDGVTSIIDDTHAVLTFSQYAFPNPAAAKVYAAPPDSSTFQMSAWQNSNIGTFWTFYDLPLAMYRLYYRTGNPTFLTQARQLADYQWAWMDDHGNTTPVPRGAGLLGQFLRALDGHTERLPSLYNLASFLQGWQIGSGVPPSLDLREAGYTNWFEAIGSKVDTNPTRHIWYCSALAGNAATFIATQYPGGWWGENVYGGNHGYLSAPLTYSPLVFGSSPWRTSILVRGLEASYEALNDTSSQGCNNTTLAASLLKTITKVVNWQWNYGRDSNNRGIYYEVQYPSNEQSTATPAGTASVNLGSKSVVGVGTSFTTAYACNGTDFIGFASSSSIYKVVSCADNTHLTITPSFGSYGAPLTERSNIRGSGISQAPPASTNCGTSLSSYCFVGTGDLNLDRLVPGEIMWLYNQTSNVLYRGYADDFFSAAFGGPATGPTNQYLIGTTYTGQGSGPNSLGYIGDNITSLADCTTNPAPCTGGGNPFVNKGKNFDEVSGAPGADNALAWRIPGNTSRPHGTVTGTVTTHGTVKFR